MLFCSTTSNSCQLFFSIFTNYIILFFYLIHQLTMIIKSFGTLLKINRGGAKVNNQIYNPMLKSYFSKLEDESLMKDKSKLKRVNGMIVNEEQIRAKIKQIKSRKKQGQKISKQPTHDFMKNYQIRREASKVEKFRRDTGTEALMHIEDVSLDQKPTILQITSYSESSIEIDKFPYPPSLIITPNQVLTWQVKMMKQAKPIHFKLLELITPPPEYIIVGCPNTDDVSQEVINYFSQFQIAFDVLSMFQAISNFNTFAQDQINVLSFFAIGQELS